MDGGKKASRRSYNVCKAEFAEARRFGHIDFTKGSRKSTQNDVMKAVLWYTGEATVVPHSKYNCRSKDNLKKGNSDRVGFWGAGSRKVFISRACYMMDRSPAKVYNMILTYRHDPDHKKSKSHINTFLQRLRRRDLYGYFYAVEYQTRKKSKRKPALHYHLIVACDLPKQFGKAYKTIINQAWCDIRGDYSPNAVRDISEVRVKRSLVGYVSKLALYCSKTAALRNSGEIPQDIRLWATSNNLVGKEKIIIQDENNVNRLLVKAYSVCEMNKNGFEYVLCDLSREDTKEFFQLNDALLKRIQREKQEKGQYKPKKYVCPLDLFF